jgi:predicted heme/steroid binding protein
MTEYTLAEVAKHNKEGDCWLVIEGNVYDVSKFLDEHPGGEEVLLDCGGAWCQCLSCDVSFGGGRHASVRAAEPSLPAS